MKLTGYATAGPSLALIKYWGKESNSDNTPATGSLAVTLEGLETQTQVGFDERDSVTVNGQQQPLERYLPFLDHLRAAYGMGSQGLAIQSTNNFPTAAGLASSSSGFAALTGAVAALAGATPLPAELSALARRGSGSATRSVFGGFTVYEAGALAAQPEHDASHWPEFRIVLAVVQESSKPISSRKAMESSRLTSPYYDRWVQTSPALLAEARAALADRDWSRLGPLIRQSYLRMFGTMFSASPLIYWQPQSLAVIQSLESLRLEGLYAWETMDAGPQVKIFCPAHEAGTLVEELGRRVSGVRFLTAAPGPGLRLWRTP